MGSFEFRHLTAGWRLDGRQHDAAEFLTHILVNPAGSLSPAHWQARTDGQVEDSDTGSTPLLLPVPAGPSGLQVCFNQWSDNTFQRALCWAPEILPVVLCRWQDGSKSQVNISWQEPIQVGVWEVGRRSSPDSGDLPGAFRSCSPRRRAQFRPLPSFLPDELSPTSVRASLHHGRLSSTLASIGLGAGRVAPGLVHASLTTSGLTATQCHAFRTSPNCTTSMRWMLALLNKA